MELQAWLAWADGGRVERLDWSGGRVFFRGRGEGMTVMGPSKRLLLLEPSGTGTERIRSDGRGEMLDPRGAERGRRSFLWARKPGKGGGEVVDEARGGSVYGIPVAGEYPKAGG